MKPVHLQVRVGSECNPSAKVLNDLHLVGTHGTDFDFNGQLNKAFCLLTDRNLHINKLLRGYYSDNTQNAVLCFLLANSVIPCEWYAGRGRSGGVGPCTYVLRTGGRRGETCGLPHTVQRCFGRLTDAWRAQFPDAVELPRWGDLLKQNVATFDLDFDPILAAMYAETESAEGDCYLCVRPDPGIEAAALGASASAAPGTTESAAPGTSEFAAPGASESTLSGTTPTKSLHTFTLDSGASRSFFRDSTTLTPLSRPVAVSLADPSGGPVLAHSSTVLPCPAAPSGLLSGLHLPSFSTNLVSGADLQDLWVDQFTSGGQRVTHCNCSRTGRHLATFTRRPGSSLYTLTSASPPVTASGQVAASGQVFAAASRSSPSSAPCSSLPPLPPGRAPTCVPCVEGRQRAAPHSSEFPPTEAPLQTLHRDVWGPARVSGQGHERYFLLVVDDYSRYTTVFPLRHKGEIAEVLIDWICGARRQPSETFGSDLPVLRLHSNRGAFVRDTSADKLSSRAVPYVFLGFPPDALGWQFYHLTSRRVLSSPDVTFDESVSYYCLFPYRAASLPPPPPPVDPVKPVEVAVDSGAARGAKPAGVGPRGAELAGAGPRGAEPGVAESEGAELGGAEPERVEPGGAEPGGAEFGGAEPWGAEPERAECGGPPGVLSRREPLSPQLLCASRAGAVGGASVRMLYPHGSILCMGPPLASAAVLPIAHLGSALFFCLQRAYGARHFFFPPRALGARRFSARRAVLVEVQQVVYEKVGETVRGRLGGGSRRVASSAGSPEATNSGSPASLLRQSPVDPLLLPLIVSRGASYSSSPEATISVKSLFSVSFLLFILTARAAGPGGTRTRGTRAAGAGGAAEVGAVDAGAIATGGAAEAGAAGGTGAGGAAGVVAGDPGDEGTGGVSAISGGAARPRP
ncbi:unnamed protein product [Closterium sp. NIES-54]